MDHFAIGDMEWAFHGRGCALTLFQLGTWTGHFSIGDMDWHFSDWCWCPTPFFLGMWTALFLGCDMYWRFSSLGYGFALFQLGTSIVLSHVGDLY